MNLSDSVQLLNIEASEDNFDQAYKALSVAIGYVPKDGTKKLCGNRCRFHLEEGPYKLHCILMQPNLTVPNVATCTEYVKGPAHEFKNLKGIIKPMNLLKPEQVGLVSGEAQCMRCTRRGKIAGQCKAVTDVLQNVLGFKKKVFTIDAEGCCNWNITKDQKPIGYKL